MSELSTTAIATCRQCGAVLPPMILACPSCTALVHADELKVIAAEAEQAASSGDRSTALSRWRSALELLPATSRQYGAIQERIRTLSREVDGNAPAPTTSTSRFPKSLAGFGALGLAALSKAKLLLLGLTKLSTLLSMIAAFGIYWQIWGWRWALGLVLTTYVHEMGHVYAMRRYGLPASAPMFIPGIGAFVRLKQAPSSVTEDAAIGLAGPIWGCASAIACFAIYAATGWTSFAAIGGTAAVINLFNLLPVWQLDGARGFKALSKPFRLMAGATALVAGMLTHDGMLLIVGGIGAFRGFSGEAPEEGDRRTLFTYVGLIIVLTLMESWKIR